ncbi:IS110 family RNA-guided transposase [Mesoterricola sediminis]|uniref:IS110 family transposase n=1 Tax=Mesoterricola sediminis TaxID=2927980 RepID=A0AA48GW38_9BACT|nr:IS110 family transposase [Mesoterricola sediminis]BDU75480.1 IS110 family transposase [Mesoterricola sediminis]
MEVLHARCAGLDLGKELVVACRRVVGSSGATSEVRSFGASVRELMRLRDWLEEAGITHVVMEATGVYWKPVWHALEDSFELILANPKHVKQVPGRKSDVNDAQWLADLLAHGLIQASFVPPRATQELRDLTRTHKQLTREVARHALRIQKVLEDADIKLSGVLTDVLGASGKRILKAIVGGEQSPEILANLALRTARKKIPELQEALGGHIRSHHRFPIGIHLAQIEAIEGSIAQVEGRLEEHLKPQAEQVRLLCTIPGIGLIAARTILAEIGSDMTRFPTVGHLVSWAGFCPQMHESAGKRKSTRIRKGAPWLKEMLVQCAWPAIKVKDSYLRARFNRLKARRGSKKAIVAIAADMLRAAYFILKREVPYTDLGGDYYDRLDSNKARANLVRRLKALGYEVQLTPVA